MTIKEFYTDSILILPKTIPLDQTYRTYLSNLLDNYIRKLKDISPDEIKIDGLKKPIKITRIVEIQRNFIKGILDTIDKYYDGQPFKAYELFSEVLNYRIGKYKNLLNINEFSMNQAFYRIRINEENFPFNQNEMFHIPFESRGKVTAQRYSIPGFPSLYLANSIYVAWEELLRPNIDKLQAVKLVSKGIIKYLDLTHTTAVNTKFNNLSYKYLMTWPLIAACSIKVKSPKDSFKPEYIIPQLLLQYVRNQGAIDGIKYCSTHIEGNSVQGISNIYNFVMPVKENNDRGLCSQLTSMFEISATVSQQLLEISAGRKTFLYNKEDNKVLDDKIPLLEIIQGKKYPYSYSAIGHLEYILNSLETMQFTDSK